MLVSVIEYYVCICATIYLLFIYTTILFNIIQDKIEKSINIYCCIINKD